MAKISRSTHILGIIIISISVLILFDSFGLAEKGRDIIIYNGKIILKGGKKKGNIVISHGDGMHGQGKYKYKKKYMDYGGFWR